MEIIEPKIVCKTNYKENIIPKETADNLYKTLYDNIKWVDGVRSKNGFTRKAKTLDIDDEQLIEIVPYIMEAITILKPKKVENYMILGVYLNLYEDGNMYTPNHAHPHQHQLVISLGAKRILKIGEKEYKMQNGSAILFGSSIHGVPKEPDIKKGRISVAVFLKPVTLKQLSDIQIIE